MDDHHDDGFLSDGKRSYVNVPTNVTAVYLTMDND